MPNSLRTLHRQEDGIALSCNNLAAFFEPHQRVNCGLHNPFNPCVITGRNKIARGAQAPTLFRTFSSEEMQRRIKRIVKLITVGNTLLKRFEAQLQLLQLLRQSSAVLLMLLRHVLQMCNTRLSPLFDQTVLVTAQE